MKYEKEKAEKDSFSSTFVPEISHFSEIFSIEFSVCSKILLPNFDLKLCPHQRLQVH
jgi:hypothetical protein